MLHFRLFLIFRSLSIDGDNLIRFDIKTSESESVSVELRRLPDTEIDKQYMKGDVLCTAAFQKKMTRNIRRWLEETEESKPSGFADFADDALVSLSYAVDRSVKLWRWRTGYHSSQKLIQFSKSFEWSSNGIDWNPIPQRLYLSMRVGLPCAITTNQIVESVLSLSRADNQEPLAHELFHEACSLRWDNPRSSLVMGIAAAETGIKQLISTLVPAAEWLVKETQSPPLVRMLEDYLPKLPVRLRIKGKVLCPPKWVIDAIVNGVNLRNQIVHGHDIQLKSDSDSLSELFEAVHELLYLYDLYSGNEWAVEHINRIRMSLENEP